MKNKIDQETLFICCKNCKFWSQYAKEEFRQTIYSDCTNSYWYDVKGNGFIIGYRYSVFRKLIRKYKKYKIIKKMDDLGLLHMKVSEKYGCNHFNNK